MLDKNIEDWYDKVNSKKTKNIQNMLNTYLKKYGFDEQLERFLKFRLKPEEINGKDNNIEGL